MRAGFEEGEGRRSSGRRELVGPSTSCFVMILQCDQHELKWSVIPLQQSSASRSLAKRKGVNAEMALG